MDKHSIISPSSAYRWIECPGSAKLESKYPDIASSYAAEGTDAHLLLEKCLVTGRPAEFYKGKDIMREDGSILLVNDEQIESVQWCLDYIRAAEARLKAKAQSETEYSLSFVHEELFGTCDVTIRQEFGELLIADLKYGKGKDVDVVSNPQLMIYALGAMGPKENCTYENVRLVILQPRTSREPKEWLVTPDELYRWAKTTLAKAAKIAAKGSKTFKVGKWCDFCKAKADCPKLRSQAMAIAGEVFDGVPLPSPDVLSPEDIGRILPKIEIFDMWSKAVQERAEAILLNGGKIPGFKIVRGRTTRAWADEDMAAKDLCETFPEYASQMFLSKLLSPAQLEKALKKELKEELIEVINRNLADKEGKPTVVPDTDKRPAIEFNNVTDFEIKDMEDLLK